MKIYTPIKCTFKCLFISVANSRMHNMKRDFGKYQNVCSLAYNH